MLGGLENLNAGGWDLGKDRPKKRSGNVPTSGDKPYRSVTMPIQKVLDFAGFCLSLSLGVFALLASMQRFESARRLHLLLHFPPVFCQALAFF